MSGTGISAFTVAPLNLLFGSVPLNATKAIPVVITNTSSVSQKPNYAGGAPNDPTHFGGSQNCAGITLSAGGSCQFTYTFTPKTLGAHSSSTTIDIDSQSFSITMSGTGTTASGLSIAPTTINFGSVLVGTTSAAMTATVTNGSSATVGPLNVVGGAPAAPFAAAQSCAGVTLTAGGTCKFSYTFAPTAPGPASGSSSFTINGEAFSVSLSGNGTSVSSLNQHGLTGSWYEAATGGQGIEVEVFANASGPGSAFVSWFTFDSVIGGAERQRWYTAQGPVVTGQGNVALTIFQNTGGNFNAPPTTTAQAVGNATLSFTTCTSGQLTYTFTDGTNRTGTIPLTRLTQNVTCAASPPYPTNADFALSGNWFGGAATSGQGLTVEVNPTSGAFFAAWYTYMPNSPSPGAAGQRWYTAQAAFTPGLRSIPVTIYETTGGMFDAPTPTGQKTVAVGTGTMAFQSCSAATFSYSFTGGTSFGLVGSINLIRVGPVPPGCAHGLGEREVMLAVPRCSGREVASLFELLACIVADGFQHSVARAPLALVGHHKRLLHQRSHEVEHVGGLQRISAADLLGRLDVEAARKYRETAQHRPLRCGQQVVGPVHQRAQCLLPFQQHASAASQQLVAVFQSRIDIGHTHCAHARGGQLQRQRYAVEPGHQLGHRRCLVLGQHERRLVRLRALDE